VTCEPRERDRYGRVVAACSVGGFSLSAWMVREGSLRKGGGLVDAPGRWPDRVHGQFTAAAPDVLWVGDITYVRTWEGWFYLATVLDVFSRRVIGWAIADHLRASLVSRRSGWPLPRAAATSRAWSSTPTVAANTPRLSSATSATRTGCCSRWGERVCAGTVSIWARWPSRSSRPTSSS
jgi:transposase InsO family protein